MINKKLVIITTKGPIKQLGGIRGPMLSPSYIHIEVLRRLLIGNIRIYEVNPNNYSEKKILTLSNLSKQNYLPKIDNNKKICTEVVENNVVLKKEPQIKKDPLITKITSSGDFKKKIK